MNQFNSLIGDFQIDHQNRVVNFNKKVLHDYDEKIKETYMKRMRHLNSLQEHIQKMMKYRVISSMKDKALDETQSLEDELEGLSELDV